MMTAEGYDRQESLLHARYLQQCEQARPWEKAEAAKDLLTRCIHDREAFTRAVEFLLNGDYGRGPQLAAQAIMTATRSNRAAQLFQLVAAYDLNTAPSRARKVWWQLSEATQLAVQTVLDEAILEAEASEAERLAEAAAQPMHLEGEATG